MRNSAFQFSEIKLWNDLERSGTVRIWSSNRPRGLDIVIRMICMEKKIELKWKFFKFNQFREANNVYTHGTMANFRFRSKTLSQKKIKKNSFKHNFISFDNGCKYWIVEVGLRAFYKIKFNYKIHCILR